METEAQGPIHFLRRNKLEVVIIHYRRCSVCEMLFNSNDTTDHTISATGGKTFISIRNGDINYSVVAHCRDDENYCKRVGIRTCLLKLNDAVNANSKTGWLIVQSAWLALKRDLE